MFYYTTVYAECYQLHDCSSDPFESKLIVSTQQYSKMTKFVYNTVFKNFEDDRADYNSLKSSVSCYSFNTAITFVAVYKSELCIATAVHYSLAKHYVGTSLLAKLRLNIALVL